MNNKLSAQEIVNQAKLTYQAGNYVLAAQGFAEATSAYTEMGDALMAAEMQNNQSVALLRAKQPQAALEVVQGTEKIFAQAGDFRREGMALANQASALQALKRDKEAIDSFIKCRRCLAESERRGFTGASNAATFLALSASFQIL